ncbi:MULTISPECIES: hypothetical protein [Deefgea]|uniref:Uncharacterized protein n=1 Tax=Deefgea chitinilytica TaxID=570276 RepID=A0ABS2C9H7_9NEIS|nr:MULTISPECIES: hypothetical protein [Deefgea]MBM5570310.1 hypothetical protein [Deefgea chitinilytica]MBM9887539.1 hypothetical protein [Deefgea sp. CFH1-16]
MPPDLQQKENTAEDQVSITHRNTIHDGDYTLVSFLKEHWLPTVAALLLTGGVFLAYAWNFHAKISDQNADWGTFGDFIGGTLNPIFGFISVILLFYAVTLQRKELKGTKEALESQSKSAEMTAELQLLKTMLESYETESKATDEIRSRSIATISQIEKEVNILTFEVANLEKASAQRAKEMEELKEKTTELTGFDIDTIQDIQEAYKKSASLKDHKNKVEEIIESAKKTNSTLQDLTMQLEEKHTQLKQLRESIDQSTDSQIYLIKKTRFINIRMDYLFNSYQQQLEEQSRNTSTH